MIICFYIQLEDLLYGERFNLTVRDFNFTVRKSLTVWELVNVKYQYWALIDTMDPLLYKL
jgi:hypothetical protein